MYKPKIFDCNKASTYKPTHPKTVLIRLLDSYHKKLELYPNFIPNFAIESRRYKKI
jgi:hypothetical protein